MILNKVLGGLQDLLLKGFQDPNIAKDTKVTQVRNGNNVELNYLNIDTIPYIGSLGDPDFKSIRDYINESIDNNSNSNVSSNTNVTIINFGDNPDMLLYPGFYIEKSQDRVSLLDYNKAKVAESFTIISNILDIRLNGVVIPFITQDTDNTFYCDTGKLLLDNNLYKKDISCLVV